MKNPLFFLCTLLLYTLTNSTNLLYAQSNTIGFVVDEQTEAPLANVKVELMNYLPIMSTHTNEQGTFILVDVPAGKHRLLVEKEGYAAQIYTFIKGQTNKIEIALKKFEDSPTLSIKDRLNTKITTASQNQESVSNAPATVHVVTAEEIEERGYTSLIDVLEDIPEVEIHEKSISNHSNHISIRGIEGAERFLILLDGMRINSMATTRHTVDKNFIIRYAKRIEIVMGPSSALYGVDAFTGVINIISKDGHKSQRADVEGSYGMYNTTDNHFFAGFGNKDLSFNLNGGVYYSKEPNLSKFYPEEFAWHNEQYSANGGVLLGSDTLILPIQPFEMPRIAYFVQGKLNIKDFEIGLTHNTQQHSSATGNQPEYSPYIKDNQYSISLSNAYIKHNWADKKNKIALKSALNYNLYHIKNNSRFIDLFTNYQSGFKFGFNHNIKLNESVNIQLVRNHNLIAGLSYQYTYALPKSSDLPFKYNYFQRAADQNFYYIGTNITDSAGVNRAIPAKFYFFGQHNAGAFVQYQGNFKDIVLLTVGARFDYSQAKLHSNNNTQHYYAFNPRLGIVIKPTEALRFKLFYGTAFLAPSPEKRFEHFGSFYIDEDDKGNFRGFEGIFWHLPNPKLAPEKIRSAEAFASYTTEEFSFSLGGYYNYMTDLVDTKASFNETFLDVPILFVKRYDNNSQAYTYGGTFKILYQHYFNNRKTSKINLYASYSYSDGRVNDTLAIPFSARHTIKSGITFVHKKLNIHTRGFFRTGSTNAERKGNAPFFLLNAFVSYRVFQSSSKKFALDLFVRARNITNNRYYSTTQKSLIAMEKAPQDPIRVMAGVRVNFTK